MVHSYGSRKGGLLAFASSATSFQSMHAVLLNTHPVSRVWAAGHLSGVPAELLAKCEWRGVLSVRSANLDDVRELL